MSGTPNISTSITEADQQSAAGQAGAASSAATNDMTLQQALETIAALQDEIGLARSSVEAASEFYINGVARADSTSEICHYMSQMLRSSLHGTRAATANAETWVWFEKNPYGLQSGAIVGSPDLTLVRQARANLETDSLPRALDSGDKRWALIPVPDHTGGSAPIGYSAVELIAGAEVDQSIMAFLLAISVSAALHIDRATRISISSHNAQYARAAARAQLRLAEPRERAAALKVALDELADCDDLAGGVGFELVDGDLNRLYDFGSIDVDAARAAGDPGRGLEQPVPIGYTILPVIIDGSTELMIVLLSSARTEIGEDEMLSGIAAAVGGSIVRSRVTGMIESLRRDATRRLVEAQERERSMIAADIHDGVLQQLGATAIRLELAQARVEQSDYETARQIIEDGAGEIRSCARELRALLMELRPQVLDDNGLKAALVELGRHVDGVEVEVNAQVPPSLGNEYSITVFRIVQEALTNIQKHARAKKASVNVCTDTENMIIEVHDDGVGYEGAVTGPSSAGSHLGLLGMRERTRMLGGEFAIEGASGGGTAVRAILPLKAQPRDRPATGDPGAGA